MRQEFQSFLDSRKLDISVAEYCDMHPLHRFKVRLGARASLSKLTRLSQELGLDMGSLDEPIFTNLYREGLVQVDLMKALPKDIYFFAENKNIYNRGYRLPLLLGKDAAGELIDIDLATAPHILVRGTTGSGKSIMLHAMIASLLPNYEKLNVRFAFIDPKQVEFRSYDNKPWNMCNVVHSASDADKLLETLIAEMERRFQVLNTVSARSISDLKNPPFPYIVLVIDELSDMMYSSGKKFQTNLIKLAQKSRAAGIHIIAATQHPSSKVIPGELKANFPVIVGCRVMSAIHSRVLFGSSGAERLLGRGDALISGADFYMKRFKGAYVDASYANFIDVGKWPRGELSFFQKIKKMFQ